MRASEFIINLEEYEDNLLAKAFIKSLKVMWRIVGNAYR